MAEGTVVLLLTKAATFLDEVALRYAISLVSEEASFLSNLHKKVEEITAEFEVMLGFLQHVDMGDQGGGGKAWADQLRGVALEVEDIIDEYTYLLGSGDRHRFRDFLRKAFGCDPKPGSLPDIAQRLKDAVIKLRHLSTMKERYSININTVGGEASSSRTEAERRQHSVVVESSHLVGEDDVFVGMEKTKADLLGWLTDDESQSRLISVWGMGGLGKTTLVTHIFDSQEVKEHFHTRALVTVSKTYTVEDLLRRILLNLIDLPNIDSMSFTSVAATLRGYLQDKRYLLVLDDVWSTDDWKVVLKYASPMATDCGSRVILTTREHDVACLGIDHVIELPTLNENEAWELFCRKAFYSTGCPPNLERLAKAILDKCDGLPLAIVALGSLLSLRKEEELEWQKVYEDLNWQLNNSPLLQRLKTILLLSIRDLPRHLKNCFLYCSVFPEDCSIPTNKLIRLWVSEGLVQSRGGLTMEDVGEENIEDLVKRTMLQVAGRNYYGRVKYCRLHDMLREVALQMSAEEKFCSIHDKPEERLYITRARRLSVHKCTQDITDGMIGRLRSFLLFDKSISTEFLWTRTQVFSGLKLVRVLDLEGASFDSVPEQVYCLFNLHYLSLKNTWITELSESVAKLRNLQVLNLNRTNVTELPRGITKLKMLRELKVFRYWSFHDFLHEYFYYSGTKSPRGLWVLKELQKLQLVEASDELVQHVGDLVKLRSFRIVKVKAAQCEELCVALSKMVQLRKLNITASGEDGEMLHLDSMSSPPQYLERLFLGGRLQNDALPHWFHSLRNLKMLFLHWTKLREDPLPLLHEALPSLVFLQLSRAYEGRELFFRAEAGFPKLKSLWLINMPFSRIKIEEGALGGLEKLELGTCPKLKMVPEGIEHLTALRVLHLVRMDSELEERVLSDPDTIEKIKRIPSITFQYYDNGPLKVRRIPSIAFEYYNPGGGGKFNG